MESVSTSVTQDFTSMKESASMEDASQVILLVPMEDVSDNLKDQVLLATPTSSSLKTDVSELVPLALTLIL